MLKKILLLLLLVPIAGFAGNSKRPLKDSPFNLGVELSSKYIWRGLEYGNSPVIFGTLGYTYKGFNAYALGAYATNGNHSEVDLVINYTYRWLLLGVSDYFFPSASGESDNYLNFQEGKTRHSVEGYITLSPERIPVWLTMSTYFYGADKNLKGNQAYSSYLELGYKHAFKKENYLSLWVGANLNKSFYTHYKSGFNVVNLAVKYETGIPMGKFTLPISGTFMYNPYANKPLFSLSIYLNSK